MSGDVSAALFPQAHITLKLGRYGPQTILNTSHHLSHHGATQYRFGSTTSDRPQNHHEYPLDTPLSKNNSLHHPHSRVPLLGPPPQIDPKITMSTP